MIETGELMKQDLLLKFKTIFETQFKEISGKTKDIELDISGDEIDKAQGDALGSVAEKLTERNIKQLRNIEKALIKIKDGSFGDCEYCGEQISERRLLAKPDAEACIQCAENIEHIAKQYI
jgi:DnaK suppressor protein